MKQAAWSSRGLVAVGEGAAERVGFFRVDDFHAEHEAASADVADEGVNLLEVEETFEEADAHFLDVAQDVVVADVIEDGEAGGHGELVAAKGASVGTGFPLIEFLAIDDDGEREAAADGFREDEDVGDDSGIFKGVESAGTAPAGLDFVEDEGDGAVVRDLANLAEPGGGGGDGAAFALNDFEDDASGWGDAAFGVGELLACEIGAGAFGAVCVAHRAAVSVRIGLELDAGHEAGDLGAEVAHEGESAVGLAVVAALEGDHALSAGGSFDEFDGGFDGVGTGGGAKLNAGVGGEGGGEGGEEFFDEAVFDGGGEVEGMEGVALVEVVADGGYDGGMVMAEGEGSGAAKAIHKDAAVNIGDIEAFGAADGDG